MAGNANSGRRRNTYITEALMIEMKAREDGTSNRGVRKMAVTIMDLAEAGERWAAEFVRDTIDGKPMQAVEHSGSISTRPDKMTDEELEAIASANSLTEKEDERTIN